MTCCLKGEQLIVGIESDSEAQRLAGDRQNKMKVAVIGLKDDHEALDRDYFLALSAAEKMAMVATMFAEQWLLKGGNADQLRLRRDIARLQRGGS